MHLIKKILILVIIIASFVIIYKLTKENEIIKQEIQKQVAERNMQREGFSTSMDELQKSAEKKGLELTIKPLSAKYADFPLREFMIKSSYNSAIVNKTADKEAIIFALTRGCRVLDFEVYTRKIMNGKDDEYVSYSDDPEYRTIKTALNLTLENALNNVAANAFSSPSPAPTDPLFIQLRIKNNSNDAYNRISKLIEKIFGSRLYVGEPVNGSTPINKLIGKVVIVLDALSAPDYDRYSTCMNDPGCVPLTKRVGLVSGTVDLPKYSYTDYYDLTQTPIMVDPKTKRTDVRTFMMVTPPEIGGDKMTIPDEDSLTRLPIQMLLVPFYKQTDDLKKYEETFNKCESSFCAMGQIFKEHNKKNAE